jgi:hypothetical protein
MMRTLLVILICAFAADTTLARERNLDRWFDGELVPYVAGTLLEHPRFKGETVMFVVLDNNAPAAIGNTLALSLRDRLLDAALNTAGVSIGWRQGGKPGGSHSQPADCMRDNVHYYIGIEITRRIDADFEVDVRALDIEDRNWVTGFGRRWQGSLSTVQRNAFRETAPDMTFQGARDVPFNADETDLLAAHLAHELGCALHRQTSGSYVVDAALDADPEFAAALQLAGRNLASHQALEFSEDTASINADLSGTAHRIDGALFQYWLTVTPRDPQGELASVAASAYVLLPGIRLAREAEKPLSPYVAPAAVKLPNPGENPVLGPLHIVRSSDSNSCGHMSSVRQTTHGNYGTDCTLLAADMRNDAILFVLEHQASHGLVRLAGSGCRKRSSPHVVAEGQRLRWPLPGTSPNTDTVFESRQWLGDPGVDTYYALAVTDATAARQIANLLDELPVRCGASIQPGLENNALHRWLDEFAILAARHEGHVDWRAIQVKDVL